MSMRPFAAASFAALAACLGACQDSGMLGGASTRSLTPIPPQTLSLMQTKGMSQADPILIRAYKKEAEMEIWKRGGNGQYALLKTFPICRWSGQLGPKTKQGDRQAPEGFYTITPGQMNPNSAYYLSFDVGYPNAYDRAQNATGNYIMVHGTCSSAGCFAMTDASMSELYAIARESFSGGQRAFQFQSYPFRMTAANVAKFRNDPNAPFWKNLKEGSDYFEALHDEPRVGVCGTRYVFGGSDVSSGSCSPKLDPLVAEKRNSDNKEIAELVAKGTPATRVVYDDGGQNPVFRPQPPTNFASLGEADKEKELAYSAKDYGRHNLGDVSRPETLAAGPREIEVDTKGRPVMIASAAADVPGPTKAAAAALDRKGKKGEKMPTLLAKAEPVPASEPKKEPTPRITVADADGDMSAYQKLLGGVLGKPSMPVTPAVDAATAPALPAEPAVATTSVARTGSIHPTAPGKDGVKPKGTAAKSASDKPHAATTERAASAH